MRPQTRVLATRILDISHAPGGRIAVATQLGVETFDSSLEPHGGVAFATKRSSARIAVTDDDRVIVADPYSPCRIEIGTIGGACEEAFSSWMTDVIPMRSGFAAWSLSEPTIVIDHRGERRAHALSARHDLGATVWGDRIALAGYEEIAIFGEDGARGPVRTFDRVVDRPIVLGDKLAVTLTDAIVVLDDELGEIARFDARPNPCSLWSLADDLLFWADDALHSLEFDGDQLRERWAWKMPRDYMAPLVAGSLVAVPSKNEAWLVDRDGELRARLKLSGELVGAYAFGDGIVFQASDAHDLTWSRSDGTISSLDHDFKPAFARAIPCGLAVAEHDVLYLWLADGDGPELPLSSAAPVGTAVIVEGGLATVRAPGRFASRGERGDGTQVRIRHGSSWRTPIGRARAIELITRLVEHRYDGDLPDFAESIPDEASRIAALPPDRALALHGRALFEPGGLDERSRAVADAARPAFLDELAYVIGGSRWNLLSALRARRFPLVPPREIAGYEYIGAFTTLGKLMACDPSHLGHRVSKSTCVHVDAREGEWHAFVRAEKNKPHHFEPILERIEELVVCHRDGLTVAATDRRGHITVNSGTAGVFDQRAPQWDGNSGNEPGIFANAGGLTPSGQGEGTYEVFAASLHEVVVKLRLSFLGSSALDRSVATPIAARGYSPRERFAVGETIDHPKLGLGTVVHVSGEGKIDVAFADGRRVLVHAKT